MQDAGLNRPEFIGGDVDLRINIYRKDYDESNFAHETVLTDTKTDTKKETDIKIHDVDENVGDVGENVGDVTDNIKEQILLMLMSDSKLSASEIAKKLSVSKRTIERHIRELREEGRLKRIGSARSGQWKIL